jgi:hypothetical protein
MRGKSAMDWVIAQQDTFANRGSGVGGY